MQAGRTLDPYAILGVDARRDAAPGRARAPAAREASPPRPPRGRGGGHRRRGADAPHQRGLGDPLESPRRREFDRTYPPPGPSAAATRGATGPPTAPRSGRCSRPRPGRGPPGAPPPTIPAPRPAPSVSPARSRSLARAARRGRSHCRRRSGIRDGRRCSPAGLIVLLLVGAAVAGDRRRSSGARRDR